LRELFPDEATCRESADARYAGGAGTRNAPAHAGDWGVDPVPAPKNNGGGVVAGAAPTMARETAAHFLPGLLKTCGGDPEKFLQALAANRLLAQHFDAESPEVLKVLTGATEDKGAGDGTEVPF
jgi:hypothetical protein